MGPGFRRGGSRWGWRCGGDAAPLSAVTPTQLCYGPLGRATLPPPDRGRRRGILRATADGLLPHLQGEAGWGLGHFRMDPGLRRGDNRWGGEGVPAASWFEASLALRTSP